MPGARLIAVGFFATRRAMETERAIDRFIRGIMSVIRNDFSFFI